LYSVSSFCTGTVAAVRELSELKQKYGELEKKLEDYELLQRSNADIRIENEHLKQFTRIHLDQTFPKKRSGRNYRAGSELICIPRLP
jgi:cell shape-determining protein MreC